MSEKLQGLLTTSDGWRAVIADGFTFNNLQRITIAIASMLKKTEVKRIRALIAHDTRFMGDKFARTVYDLLESEGVSCDLVKQPIPTPLVSWYVKEQNYNIGLTITASHNPSCYSGMKIRLPYGGPPDKYFMKAIENEIPVSFKRKITTKEPKYVDPTSTYVDQIKEKLDLKIINSAAPVIALDSMHGTTTGLLKKILADTRSKIIQVRGNPDPLFGGTAPEPKKTSMGPLARAVKKNKCVVGFAHDGDGDRIVAYDPESGYLSPHDLAILMAFDLAERKSLPGSIVASVSTTSRLKSLALFLERDFHEVPIGFHNATKIMINENVLVAGEENGGIGVGHYLPERDATFAAALFVEMISSRRMGLGRTLSDLDKKIGKTYLKRLDLHVSNPTEAIKCFGENLPSSLLDKKVLDLSQKDGIKLYLEDGAWVLLRAAGTEPLLRIYVETGDDIFSDTLVKVISKIIAGK